MLQQTRIRTVLFPLVFAATLAAGACFGDGDGQNGNGVPNPPSQAQIDDAKARVNLAVEVAGHARDALEILGIWPVYDCGEPRGTFVGELADQFELDHPCATVTTTAGADQDTVQITFPASGCDVDGYTLTGEATLRYSGGTDRLDLEADLRDLVVDGVPIQSRAGYGTCGDQESVWVESSGSLPSRPSVTFALDLTVTLRAGIPVFGADTLVLNGTGQLTSSAGTDSLTLQGLELEVGEVIPSAGTLIVQTAGGTTLRVTFSSNFLYGEAEIRIDDHDPVRVPLL